MNTGSEVGSLSCLDCAVWRCEGHKIARKKEMANDQLLTLLNLSRKEVVKVWPKYGFGLKSLPNGRREMAMSSSTRDLDERRMIGKEKNPKQVLIDWVTSVQHDASMGNSFIHTNSGCSKEDKLNEAAEYFSRILGQCQAMMTVLKNSD